MGVYEGRGTLAKAIKTLEARWQETEVEWNDAQSRDFEKRFIAPINVDLQSAVAAMDQVAVLLSRIRQECQ